MRGLVYLPIRRPLLIGGSLEGFESRVWGFERALKRFTRNLQRETRGLGLCHPSSVVEHSLGKGEVVGSNPMGGSWVFRG